MTVARISVSKYQHFQTCRRLFFWEHVLHMERVKQDGARGFGKLFHAGLEAWWLASGQPAPPWASEPNDAPILSALDAITKGALHVDTDKYDVAKARAMMIGYHARWQHLEYDLVGKGVEESFEIPLTDPDGHAVPGWNLVGRTDSIVLFYDSARKKIVEHKTTSQDIRPGSDYWRQLETDLQPSMYVDAAVAGGHDVAGVLYDVASKPDVSPELTTPEEKRTMTVGKGCKTCGGSAKAGEIRKGSGVVMVEDPTWNPDVNHDGRVIPPPQIEAPCPDCDGDGWKKGDAPRYHAKVRLKDEPPEDFEKRVLAAIDRDPESCFKQVDVPRRENELAEARADMVAATVEIDALFARARAASPGGNLRTPQARRVFARNHKACRAYGRPCDWAEVCNGRTNPYESKLYRIKPKGEPK